MIGENDDAGPINPVRFMFPKFPSRKSIAPSAINIYPIICINVFYFVTGVPSRYNYFDPKHLCANYFCNVDIQQKVVIFHLLELKE